MKISQFARPGIVTALVSALLSAAPAFAADKTDKAAKPAVFATVNGTTIGKNVADAFIAGQLAQGVQDTKEFRDAVREELIRREILSQEAKKKGLDKAPEIAAQIELARQAVLIRALIDDSVKKNPVTEADQRAEYDRLKADLSGNEFKARHILVDNEDAAKAIIEQLGKGAKFDDLAKGSKDTGSKDKGGDLGWNLASAFVKPFGDALGTLEKGKYTATPVKSDFGYHVIMLEDARPAKAPDFDQVKGQIGQRLQQQKIEKLIVDLRDKAKV